MNFKFHFYLKIWQREDPRSKDIPTLLNTPHPAPLAHNSWVLNTILQKNKKQKRIRSNQKKKPQNPQNQKFLKSYMIMGIGQDICTVSQEYGIVLKRRGMLKDSWGCIKSNEKPVQVAPIS